ncbi:hypothetical protein BLA28_21555 [Eisenbergiella tayi]|uniref:hypothetical protein n=1 Tax=Eisenbergiella tayi TaxID=1432052 RepID=UPI0008FD67E0|nr:hypothetical protein [Eisenbergiella tayi]OIZ62953.1 hypothetical protein BLA28_21555 [Eisenbergiella tayi]
MSTFKTMTKDQTKEMQNLLMAADAILGTSTPVIKGNSQLAKTVGTVIGGAAGAAIAASAGTIGVTGSLAAGGLGVMGAVGGGVAAVAAWPVAIAALILGGVGYLFGKNQAKKKEQQKQANYIKELTRKQQELYKKYNDLKAEYEKTDKEKDDIIKKQQEKLAEYEALFEALKKEREKWESNLSAA